MDLRFESGAPAKATPESKMMQASLAYATRYGFSVLPCAERDKIPLTQHGVKDASKDPAVIESWWARWPNANVGIACGRASGGLLVLDIDGPDGEESLRNLERQYGELPVTAQVLTGKGRQFYWKAEREFKNRVRVAPGVDIRADAGYVIAPPSIHPNGKSYAWEISSRIDEVVIAPLPQWLSNLLSEDKTEPNQRKDWSEIAANGAPVGARNQTLASVAGHLFRRHVDAKLAYALLWSWNQCCTQRPLSKPEFDRTVNSIAMAELARKKRSEQC